MPFALPFLFLMDLSAAAITFAVVVSVPMWRRSAITAPVFIFISAPMTAFSILLIFSSVESHTRTDSRDPILFILPVLASISILGAYIACLVCRFIFQTVSPRLECWLGLRPFLILQAAILSGGILSLLVLLLVTLNAAHQIWLEGSRPDAVAAALIGAVAMLACVLALRRLGNPEQYQPRQLPDLLGRHIYGDKA